MKLTPLDIKKQTFRKVMRGLDPEEVRSYLDMLAEDWGSMRDEVRRLQEKQREDAAKLEHYTRVEEALQEALRTARESARRAIANAERKAELLVQAAEQEADAVKSAAVQERHQIRRETKTLTTRRDEVAARLRAFLQSELELLARFDEARQADRAASPFTETPPGLASSSDVPTSGENPIEEPAEPLAEAAPETSEPPGLAHPTPEPTEASVPALTETSPVDWEHHEEAVPSTPGFRVHALIADDAPPEPEDAPMASEEEMRQIRALMQDME